VVAPPDGGTNRPFLPLRSRPRSCLDRGRRDPPEERGISEEAPSRRVGSSCGWRRISLFLVGRDCDSFRCISRGHLIIASRRRAGWRARSLSSFTPRRRSSGNGRAFGSSSGIPRLDSFWDAPVPVGVSFNICNSPPLPARSPVLELFDPPFGEISL